MADNSNHPAPWTKPGRTFIHKQGRNVDVDTAASGVEDIWDAGGPYNWLTTARLHDVTSDNANDTSAGTGARTVIVYGLNANYNAVSETITMNGTSNVATTNTYLRVYSLVVATAGSGNQNAGKITCTAQTDSLLTAQINAGNNESLQATYTIPAGLGGYITGYYGSVGVVASAASVDIFLKVRPQNQVFQTKHVNSLHSDGNGYFQHKFDIPIVVAEKSDIVVEAVCDVDNSDVCGGFDLILI